VLRLPDTDQRLVRKEQHHTDTVMYPLRIIAAEYLILICDRSAARCRQHHVTASAAIARCRLTREAKAARPLCHSARCAERQAMMLRHEPRRCIEAAQRSFTCRDLAAAAMLPSPR